MRLQWIGILLLGLIAGCGGDGAQGPQGGGGMPPTPVVAAMAQSIDLKESIQVVGSIEANESVEIQSEIDGTVETIAFEEGQQVEKGQLLIQLDPRKLQAELEQAEAQLVLAQSIQERLARLSDSGAVSKQEIDRAQAEFAAAQAQAALAKERLDDTHITAPFDGVTGARRVSPGQYVSRGALLTSVVDLDPVKAAFYVPERYFGALQIGQDIEMHLAAYGDEVFKGQVSFIDPRVRSETRTVLIKALVPNPDHKLRSGMFAEVELVLDVHEQAVVIPESAVMWQGGQASVFVVDAESKAESRSVQPGLRRAGKVELVSGVRAGEKVIIEGTQKIGPGAPVQARMAESGTENPPQQVKPKRE